MIRTILRALSAAAARVDRALGVDAYIHRHVHAALSEKDTEFERACEEAVAITRDGLQVLTTADIDRMIAEAEQHLRYEARGGNAT